MEAAPLAAPIPHLRAPLTPKRRTATSPTWPCPPATVTLLFPCAAAPLPRRASPCPMVDAIQELSQPLAKRELRVMAFAAACRPPGHGAARTPAALAATAVVRGQTAPGGVQCQQRARGLALSACPPMPGLLAASRGRTSAAAQPRRPRRVAEAAAAAADSNTRGAGAAGAGGGRSGGARRAAAGRESDAPGARMRPARVCQKPDRASGQRSALPTSPRGPIRL